MRYAIIAQCFGCLGMLSLRNGTILVYLNSLGFSDSMVMIALALPFLIDALFRIPIAYFADRLGRKRIGSAGLVVMTAGWLAMLVSSFLPFPGHTATIAALVLVGIGVAMSASGWFAILRALVPEDVRGRFFGRLRFSWQLGGVIFAACCTGLLAWRADAISHRIILSGITIAQVIRMFFYARIPELEKRPPTTDGLWPAIANTISHGRFASFCAYAFLLALATAGVPALFGLIEKITLDLPDNTVVLLGNMTMVGAVSGFFVGGRLIDKWGTKPAFLVCHVGYAICTFAFIARGLLTSGMVIWLGSVHFAYGVVAATSSIALSTELLGIIPEENKSLSTSIAQALAGGGGALSAVLGARAISSGMLSPSWLLAGTEVGVYDSVLLVCGTAILAMVVTLGLVPSVIGKRRLVPNQRVV